MPAHLPGEEIPLIGHQIARVGRVINIMAMPCDTDPVIGVYAFAYGALIGLGTLFKPAYLNDQEENFQRLPGERPGRHGRRRFHADKEFPGVGPGARKLGWWLFYLGSWGQKLGWYFMIVDVGTALAVNWTSLAYTWSGCTDPTSPRAKATLNYADFVWAGSPYDLALMSAQYSIAPCFANIGGVGCTESRQGGTAMSAGLIEYVGAGTRATKVILQFYDAMSSNAAPPQTLHWPPLPGESYTHVHRDWHLFGPGSYWKLRVLEANGGFGVRADMRINQSKLTGLGPDP